MTLLEEINFISNFNNLTNPLTIDTFINDFPTYSDTLIESVFNKFNKAEPPFFYYCAKCISDNSVNEKITPFVNHLNNINVMIDAYNAMTLCNIESRKELGIKITKLLQKRTHVDDDYKENLLLFLIDFEPEIDLNTIEFRDTHRWDNTEIRFGSTFTGLSIEDERGTSTRKHFILNVVDQFLSPAKINGFKFHYFYLSHKGWSSSRFYDKKNSNYILKSLDFDNRNLYEIDFFNFDPLSFFDRCDKICAMTNNNEASFLSTFLNKETNLEQKLSFLESVSKKTLGDSNTIPSYVTAKLYFDTAFISDELNGIENFDFIKYPTYAKVVFTQIMDNFEGQYPEESIFDTYYKTISYLGNNSRNPWGRDSQTTDKSFSNGLTTEQLKSKKITINDFQLLLTKMLPFFQSNHSEPTSFLNICKFIIKSKPDKTKFLKTVSNIFNSPESYFFYFDQRFAETVEPEIQEMLRELSSLPKYSEYFLSDFAQKGLFSKAALIIENSNCILKTSLRKIFNTHPELLSYCSSSTISNVILVDLHSEHPKFSKDFVSENFSPSFLSLKDLKMILKDEQLISLIHPAKLTRIFIDNFSTFSESEIKTVFNFFFKHFRVLFTDKNFISDLVSDDDKKKSKNKILFIEHLIKTQGNLEIFELIVELAKQHKITLSAPFKENYYYLIDGALDELFS